jgi:hypothetical protein
MGTRRRPSVVINRSLENGHEAGDVEAGEIDDFSAMTTNEERRLSIIMNTPQMRSQRLIGHSNPRYQWETYWKTEKELKGLKKPV